MTLSDYLVDRKITHAAFAEKIGTSQVAVTRYANGARIPRPAVMSRIERETGGAVSPNDFVRACSVPEDRAA